MNLKDIITIIKKDGIVMLFLQLLAILLIQLLEVIHTERRVRK